MCLALAPEAGAHAPNTEVGLLRGGDARGRPTTLEHETPGSPSASTSSVSGSQRAPGSGVNPAQAPERPGTNGSNNRARAGCSNRSRFRIGAARAHSHLRHPRRTAMHGQVIAPTLEAHRDADHPDGRQGGVAGIPSGMPPS